MSFKGPNYTWRQTLSDVSVVIPFDQSVKARDVEVKFEILKISVRLKSAAADSFILKGELCHPIKPKDSTWQIENGKILTLELQKQKTQEWWKCVIKGHEEIDTTTLEPENSKLSDLDDETRSVVEKMMFDQRQKALGKPTSEEQQRQTTLEQFMKSHPEMDFSQAKIQ